MEEKKFCVYCHTAPDGKRYIGITSRKPEKRWRHGKGYYENEHFTRAINKYGWDSFQHIILFEGLTREEASEKEKLLILKYETTNRDKGYNISKGGFGGGYSPSEETKQKIREAKKGKPCPEYQRKWLSTLNKGKIPTNLDEVHKKNMKPVNQYDMEGNYMATYPSITIAGEMCGIMGNTIGCCCRGLYKTAGGYIWKFAKDSGDI